MLRQRPLPAPVTANGTRREPRRANAETRLLYRITKDLLQPHQTLAALSRAVVQHLADFGFERASVSFFDPSSGELQTIAESESESESESEPPLCRRKRSGGARRRHEIIGRVLKQGEATIVPCVGPEAGAPQGEAPPPRAFICVPILTISRRIVGSLSVECPPASDEELNWDRRLLSVAATLMGKAIHQWRDRQEEAESRHRERALFDNAPVGPRDIVGSSRQMREVFQLIEQVAPFDTPVLVRGESGTGKELVAKAIHEASSRATGPFVGVNCGALPEQLVESELFGHVRGAYTGAVAARRGRFELANGGTLLLDEIGELSPVTQVKLLRALQSGEIHRVGDEHALRVDVRIIAATNADLEAAMRSGKFREDLFYRLNVFPMLLPPLRERKTDITQLADHFVEKYSKANRCRVVRISTPAIELMTAYHWPGNVRELENCIARAVLLARDGVIRGHHLPPTLQTGKSSGTTKTGSLKAMMSAYEREILMEAMKNAGGNMAAAARSLATTERILAYRLRRHDLHRLLATHRREGSRDSDVSPHDA